MLVCFRYVARGEDELLSPKLEACTFSVSGEAWQDIENPNDASFSQQPNALSLDEILNSFNQLTESRHMIKTNQPSHDLARHMLFDDCDLVRLLRM